MTQGRKLEELTFELTRKCPLHCIICSSNGGECYPSEFDTKQIKAIIDESVRMGVRHISLSGGEPLVRADILEICDFIKAKEISLDVYSCGNIESSNGTISPIPSNLINALKRIGVDRLIFAIHGSTPEIHDRTTATMGSYRNLIDSMTNSINEGLRSELHFVPTRINFRSLPRIMKQLIKWEAHRLSVLRFVPQGRGLINRKELELAPYEIQRLKNLMMEIRAKYDDAEFRVGAPFNSFHIGLAVPCTAGMDKATIRADGRVFPCVSMKGLINKSNGNDLKEHPLQHIWHNAELFHWVRAYLSMSLNGSKCSDCYNYSECMGGCLTQRILVNLQRTIDAYCIDELVKTPGNFSENTESEPISMEGYGYESISSR
jgi:radical SAM protein with 4Fe4S-binding SPASM domain